MYCISVLSALVPSIILLWYIYRKDSQSPEPVHALVIATLLGVLSILLSLCMSLPLLTIGIIPKEIHNFWDAINRAFLGAAIPEELAKLFVLWLFLRKNKYFDERMDGIVYAVCVALGFAGFENILYVVYTYVAGETNWVTIALARAFTAVPGHFCNGVLMGYFYSLAHFSSKNRTKYIVMTILAPIIAHGIYDAIPFTLTINISTWSIVVLMLVFIAFCFYLWRSASRAIKAYISESKPDANVS